MPSGRFIFFYDFFPKKILIIISILLFSSFCSANQLSIMTWNAGDSDRTPPNIDEMYELVSKAPKKPDILILQEIFFNNFKGLKERLNFSNSIHSSQISTKILNLGILSSCEISKSELIVFSNKISGALKAEINHNGQALNIYCVHFEYIRKKTRDKNGYVDLKFNEIFNILKKEIYLQNPRKNEANKLLEIAGKPGKATILAGDFNTISFSSSIKNIKKYYNDAMPFFKSFVSGTYKKIHSPIKPRIDYIFHSPDINVKSFKIIRQTPGDHFPVIADISIKT
jgi:endonuclease/exonuclease/phosphatase family metal-dependent hydrolase